MADRSGRTPGAPRPRRGRPLATSREAILDTAVALLESEPHAPLSLHAIARALGLTPMTLYTYFASKDALFQALSARLLEDFAFEPDPAAPPEARILAWAEAMRAHFLRHPRLIDMLAWEGHASIAWLSDAVRVFDALAALGLEGETLARAARWVWSTVMGAINYELRDRAEPISLTTDELTHIEGPARAVLAAARGLAVEPEESDRFFAFQMARMRDGLLALRRPAQG